MAADAKKDDERARRAAAELKETEDLLAGFDRPGRTPRTPPVTRDFVDYHLEKRRSNPVIRSAPAGEERGRRDQPTAIIPGHKRRMPAWLPWAGLLAAMSVLGVLVAAAVSGPPLNGPSTTSSTSLPSAATTLASGSPAFEPTTGPARDIPPPPPPTASEPSPNESESERASVSPTPAPTMTTGSGTAGTSSPTADATATNAAAASTARRPVSAAGTTAPASAPTNAASPSAPPVPSPAPSPAPTAPASATVDLIRNL